MTKISFKPQYFTPSVLNKFPDNSLMNNILINSVNSKFYPLQLLSAQRCLSTKKPTIKNPYDTLGITRKANQKEIKDAYYRLSKQYHPDVNQSKEAAIRFQDITNAYEKIGNEESRSRYDRDTTATARVASGGGMRRTAGMMRATREPERQSFEPGEEFIEFYKQRRKQQHQQQDTKANFFTPKMSAVEAWQIEQEKLRKEKEEQPSNKKGLNVDDFFKPINKLDESTDNPTKVTNSLGGAAYMIFGLGLFYYGLSLVSPDLTYQPKHFDAVLKKFNPDSK